MILRMASGTATVAMVVDVRRAITPIDGQRVNRCHLGVGTRSAVPLAGRVVALRKFRPLAIVVERR